MSVTILGSKAATCEYYSDFLRPSSKAVSYKKVEDIAQGGYSNIVLVISSEKKPNTWVLKLPLLTEDLTKKASSLTSNTNEAKILKFLNEQEKSEGREFLIQLIAFFTIKNEPVLLFPRYELDLAFGIRLTSNGVPAAQTLSFTKQLLEISAFLKRQGVIHRDIKPHNIFLLEDAQIRLADFGLAFFKKDRESVEVGPGTKMYVSPEIFNWNGGESRLDFANDMWAIACTIYRMVSRKLLFGNTKPVTDAQIMSEQNALFTPVEPFESNFERLMAEVEALKEPEEKDSLNFLKGALKQMLDLDPEKRLSPEKGLALIRRHERVRKRDAFKG